MIDAVPISLGYFAVSLSLGIAAGNADFSIGQGLLWSILNLSSSGQYAGIVLTREQASVISVVLMTLVANARYILMSCALSQRLNPKMPFFHRFLIGYALTDEIFGLEIANAASSEGTYADGDGLIATGYVRSSYVYGAMLIAIPGWALGTCLGILMGDIVPPVFSQALNVAIYGMFLAIIIPPAKKDRIVLICVVISFTLSLLSTGIPFVRDLSQGTRILLITVILSAIAALWFPVVDKETSP